MNILVRTEGRRMNILVRERHIARQREAERDGEKET
jgi:hypothetical protein